MTHTPDVAGEGLKPCPHCGSLAEFVREADEDGDFVAVQCTGCGCGSGKHYPIMDSADSHAAGEWNRRPSPAPDREETDYAAIGRDFLRAIEAAAPDYPWVASWSPAESYGELVTDLLDLAFSPPALGNEVEETLRFYADEAIYQTNGISRASRALNDSGRRARSLLAKLEGRS